MKTKQGLIQRARLLVERMTPEEKAVMKRDQRASYIIAMTTPCEHGVLDFEQCPGCLSEFLNKNLNGGW